jgi:hypothetical protein
MPQTVDRSTLLGYFERRKKPTQGQYADLINTAVLFAADTNSNQDTLLMDYINEKSVGVGVTIESVTVNSGAVNAPNGFTGDIVSSNGTIQTLAVTTATFTAGFSSIGGVISDLTSTTIGATTINCNDIKQSVGSLRSDHSTANSLWYVLDPGGTTTEYETRVDFNGLHYSDLVNGTSSQSGLRPLVYDINENGFTFDPLSSTYGIVIPSLTPFTNENPFVSSVTALQGTDRIQLLHDLSYVCNVRTNNTSITFSINTDPALIFTDMKLLLWF